MQGNKVLSKHIYAIDYLRIIASLMVVSIHVDTITSSPTNYLGGISWWMANIIQSISRSSVPLFVLISGFLFTEKYDKSKIVHRFIVPTIFWVSFYFWTQMHWSGRSYDVSSILKSIFYSEVGHLYYLYIAIGLYLGVPYIWKYLAKLSLSTHFIGLLFFSSLVLFFFNSNIYNPFFTAPLLWVAYTPYFLLGSKLRNSDIPKIIPIFAIIIFTIINTISNYFGYILPSNTAWWMNHNGNYFLGNFSPSVAVIALSIFVLTLDIFSGANSKYHLLTKYLASFTYGIFLIHPFVIPLFDRYTNLPVHNITHNLWLYLIVKIALIYLISFVIIYIFKKLRYGRTIIGES